MNFPYKTFPILFFIIGITFSVAAQTTATTATSTTDKLEKQTLKIKGATCKTDLGMIVTNIKKLKGVKSCEIAKRGATSLVKVAYFSAQVDYDKIKSTVENTGTCEDPNARRYKVKL